MKRNLNHWERGLRLILAIALVIVTLQQTRAGAPSAAVLVVAACLFLNAVLGRCYLWKWLGVDSASAWHKTCGRLSRRVTKPRTP